jgi:hypothetical protein
MRPFHNSLTSADRRVAKLRRRMLGRGIREPDKVRSAHAASTTRARP